MGVLEINIDQLPKIAFSAMLVHLASKKLKKLHVEGPRQQFWTCTRFIGCEETLRLLMYILIPHVLNLCAGEQGGYKIFD